MDPRLLTESGWKAIALKFKVKDNGLQRALAAYEKLGDDEHDDRIKRLATVSQLSDALKKNKEVDANAAVAKYLDDLVSAAELEQREITKAKALAEKAQALAAKAEAAAGKKAEAEAKTREQEEGNEADGEEEEAGDYKVKLMAAFQKLKSGKDLSYQFIVCDAKPHCGVIVAKRISSKHKEELTKITGGSKRFLHPGTCHFEDGRFTFTMDKPVTGLARKLQDSIKNFTGKKFPIKVGAEAAEDDEGEPSAGVEAAKSQPAAAPKPGRPTLEKAPEAWHQTRQVMTTSLEQLKAAIRKEFAAEGPDLIAEIDKNMKKLDGILDKLDRRLADSLAKAQTAKDPAARKTELNNSKTILADYIKYVKAEPLIAEIDSNPFGVKTNLKKVLTDSLTHMAQAIG